MIQASVIHGVLLALLPLDLFKQLPIVLLLVGAASAFLLTYLLTFAVRAFSYRVGWLDRPAARRVHTVAVPRLGGVAMFLSFLLVSLLLYTSAPVDAHSQYSEQVIYWLFIVAATLTVLVHAYDDVMGLKPLPKIIAQSVAVLIILAPGRTTFHGILLFSFNNPFPWIHQSLFYLFVDDNIIRLASIPAVLFTWFWIAGMMNTVNLIDGVDGLATGVVGITALFITVISWMLHQNSIAILSGIFSGAVLGFLPHNWHPAKIFMGDSGAMFLGLGLAVLSTMGGAKLALALMVLGVPILDVAVVALNRVRRGQRPWHYDKTHLHHRLLATGLGVRQICYLFYSLTLAFGLLAISLSNVQHLAHFYKFIGVALVGVAMIALIAWIDYRQRQRGIHIKLGKSDLGIPTETSMVPPAPTQPADSSERQDRSPASELRTEQPL
ncbi:MAG: undecaprenyl/decaprenyl-phosphate alpha-N-acetylglucosaminyl 1-phosphate transferase [Ktedonobacteraceae bacterium]|nr:undecaprenyl/decaprenyl-phosphate alpha-N-acetylglucosaminyl 1-phosphate transferase [Ktedonobacteraceae bacterium]